MNRKSIIELGFLSTAPIILHEIPDEVRGSEQSSGESTNHEEFKYEIVDGRHRFFAATELGLTSVPARVFPKETNLTQLLKTGYN